MRLRAARFCRWRTLRHAATDMLHLDPSWLDLVRRLADHNLVDNDEGKQGTIKQQLREYARLEYLDLEPLWDMHRCVEA